jgi:PKD repeat protein
VLDASSGLIDIDALGMGIHGLAVAAGIGTCATGDTLLLEVVAAPALSFSETAAAACVESEVVLTVDAIDADSVEWHWADQPASTDSLLFAPAMAGTEEFEVFAYDVESGCSTSATWQLTVHPTPEFDVFSDVDAGCSPLQVAFAIEGVTGSSEWNWSLNDEQVGAEATLELAFDATDTLSTSVVGVSLVDANGCAGFASKAIQVWPQPNAEIDLEEAVVCGFPSTVQAVAGTNAGDEVYWNVNDEPIATGDTVSVSLLSIGWHSVEAVLTNAWGCTHVAVDSIEVLPLPSAALSAEPMMGCGPLEVLMNVVPGEAEPTLSLLHEGTTSLLPALDSVLVLNQPGAYQLMLHVVDDRGCENTVELADSITVFPSPLVDFEANPYAGTFENPDPLNSTWSFENLSDAGEALWDFGDGTLSTIWNGAHTYDQPGTYAVNVMVVNAFGCAGEATLEVEVEENLQVFVPNAFTPPTNGYSDGVNDGWRPEISAPELVDSYWLRVFNRYGQLIWESHDPEEYWIGQAAQESAFFGMNDAYTWVLRVESRAQRPAQREWRGHVTLIR